MTWQQDALCRVPPCQNSGCLHHNGGCPEVRALRESDSRFFGDGESGQDNAVKVCLRCPVWEECLRDAATSTDAWKYGVRGGVKDTERKFRPGGYRGGTPVLEPALEKARARRPRRTRTPRSLTSLAAAGIR